MLTLFLESKAALRPAVEDAAHAVTPRIVLQIMLQLAWLALEPMMLVGEGFRHIAVKVRSAHVNGQNAKHEKAEKKAKKAAGPHGLPPRVPDAPPTKMAVLLPLCCRAFLQLRFNEWQNQNLCGTRRCNIPCCVEDDAFCLRKKG